MSKANSSETNLPSKPKKPSADFPLTPHPNGRWCKKRKGKLYYFGKWEDSAAALKLYHNFLNGKPAPKRKARGKRHHQAAKPSSDFPLTAHPSGRWCKKVLGKLHYFGPVADPQAALDKWREQKDDLLAGPTPRAQQPDGLTLRELANRYLTYKQARVTTGELSERTFTEYHATCERLLRVFGRDRLLTDLKSDDFETLRADIAKKWGSIRLGNEVQRVRSIFKYAFDADLIDKPVKFGPGFRRPSLKTMRKQRAEKGPRMFQAEEVAAMLKATDGQLRAMILLGVNAGFGNEDVAKLPLSALDLAGGWVAFPRPTTGTLRKCKLWPETVAALQEVLTVRKAPKNEGCANLVFITKRGQSWASESYGSAITHEMDKALRKLKLKRVGTSFYALRHTFRTVADGSRDQKACDYIMGHVDSSIAGHYIEGIEDERLERVSEHVRNWLFPKHEGSADRATGKEFGRQIVLGRSTKKQKPGNPAAHILAGSVQPVRTNQHGRRSKPSQRPHSKLRLLEVGEAQGAPNKSCRQALR